jgi:hypothetical protein
MARTSIPGTRASRWHPRSRHPLGSSVVSQICKTGSGCVRVRRNVRRECAQLCCKQCASRFWLACDSKHTKRECFLWATTQRHTLTWTRSVAHSSWLPLLG